VDVYFPAGVFDVDQDQLRNFSEGLDDERCRDA
jgi:hypothetical protein